ncbi:NUDIX domain-containing protein [Sphingomonas sinipercae]|uniref:NUDIX domain-containing protein n=1 Tax=Sphingomonas sinipercae TaxID=2714944 RepID=A0A6G7ZPK8_9SPHN|nr:NUDIX domain-containing protein [Sphingomonas sinipercae]QIL02873.1 NUDIX domain-containing protein [Sphingomonas sinipercae]
MDETPAIPAATLVVVRDRPIGPPELLMVERAQGMAFAAGALVFPGGRIDAEDRLVGQSAAQSDGGARTAALRETLEETAIPIGLSPLPTKAQALLLQRELIADRPFAELLQEHALQIDPDLLVPFARWVPKFHATRRFDTMFYVARAPDGDWPPNVVPGECSGAFWLTAQEAIKRADAGESQMIFPTRRNLERLAQHSSFDDIQRDAERHQVTPISPWVETSDGERFITIPEGIGYPVVREKMDGLWRG